MKKNAENVFQVDRVCLQNSFYMLRLLHIYKFYAKFYKKSQFFYKN